MDKKGRFPKFESLELRPAIPSNEVAADTISIRRLFGEIDLADVQPAKL
jgi:hypothetical protein